MPRPNILLITADQLRFDALSTGGNTWVHTPNIARLARAGVNFRQSFTPCPICVPARACITTGNYPHFATGTANNSGHIHGDQPILAEHFGRAGYATYAVGKLHYTPYSEPGQPRLVHGFESVDLTESGRIVAGYAPDPPRGLEDYYDYLEDVGWQGFTRAHAVGNNDVHPAVSPLPAEHNVDSWVANTTIRRLREHHENRGDNPFLTWMSFPKPHSPYDPPDPWHRFYDPRTIPEPFGTPEMLDGRSPFLSIARTRYNWSRMSPQAIQVARAHYHGLITFQDSCIGRVLDYLDSTPEGRNTIICFNADHGDLLGDFGCFFKSNFLNGSVRVPQIWSAPGLMQSDVERDDLVGLQDIMPTLCSLADVPLEHDVHGMDLSQTLRGESALGREVYVAECHDAPRQQVMACDGRWKYIHSEMNGVEELYDQQEDPHELCNLASEVGEIVQRLRASVVEWSRETGRESLLDGDDLVSTPADVESEMGFADGSQGWRWF
jgi:arylsulfatase